MPMRVHTYTSIRKCFLKKFFLIWRKAEFYLKTAASPYTKSVIFGIGFLKINFDERKKKLRQNHFKIQAIVWRRYCPFPLKCIATRSSNRDLNFYLFASSQCFLFYFILFQRTCQLTPTLTPRAACLRTRKHTTQVPWHPIWNDPTTWGSSRSCLGVASDISMAELGTPIPDPLTFWWLVTSSLLLPSSSASFTFSSCNAESCWDFWAAACFRVSLQGQWVQGYHRNKTGKETVGDDQLHSTEENISGSRDW